MRSSHKSLKCVLRATATVGESPLWHGEEKKLYWIDIQKRKLHRFNPATGSNQCFSLPELITSFAFRRSGGLILSLKKRLAFFDPEKRKLEHFASVERALPNNRFNDGKCDANGNFWAGTMNAVSWKAASGKLYRINPQLQIRAMRAKVVCSNGSGWSPDGRIFYHTESFRYTIYAYDFDARNSTISRRRVFARVDSRSGGFPDGMTVDREGYVWSCQVGLGRIARYNPEGEIESYLDLPVPRPTDCTFGGQKLDTLYITSARETMDRAALRRYPLSGSLFAFKPGVLGIPAATFAG